MDINSHTCEPMDAARDVVNRLRKALNERDIGLWLETLYSDDDIANEAQKAWFTAYLCETPPLSTDIQLLDAGVINKSISVKCRLLLEYRDFEPLEEQLVYTVDYVDSRGEWCVVWLEKIPLPFRADLEQARPFDFGRVASVHSGAWWEDTGLLSSAGRGRDPLSPSIYARAVARNIRFREAHPDLECASILSNIMSLRVEQLAAQVYSRDKAQLLSNVYNASTGSISVRLVRHDRDNTWSSKFLAPWHGFDETLELSRGEDKIPGSCFSYMSFFFAALRLGGFGMNEILQLRSGNQDLVVVYVDSEPFLICTDRIVRLTPKTLYHRSAISRIFTDNWFWTSQGATNLPQGAREQYRHLLGTRTPFFQFPFIENESCQAGMPACDLKLPDFGDTANPFELNRMIHKYIFELSGLYPDSPCTWAKYAHQTLFVSKPESYAVWSLQSPAMQGVLKEFSSTDEFLKAVSSYESQSIFLENHRIMTADQVIRHKKGDAKSKALLLYSWLKLKENKEGFVLFTTEGCYCVWPWGDDWRIWDAEAGKLSDLPRGDILLAFDDKFSYYPLSRDEDIRGLEPQWFKALRLWYSGKTGDFMTKY